MRWPTTTSNGWTDPADDHDDRGRGSFCCAGPGSSVVSFDGEAYQARFDALTADGMDVHGEARFVLSFDPRAVLDAGCGTGRVAIELACRGVEVVGVDVDRSMLSEARRRGRGLTWIEADLATLDLGRTFDVVVLAGNVPNFCASPSRPALVQALRRPCCTWRGAGSRLPTRPRLQLAGVGGELRGGWSATLGALVDLGPGPIRGGSRLRRIGAPESTGPGARQGRLTALTRIVGRRCGRRRASAPRCRCHPRRRTPGARRRSCLWPSHSI